MGDLEEPKLSYQSLKRPFYGQRWFTKLVQAVSLTGVP
jgi:hypothetical protein